MAKEVRILVFGAQGQLGREVCELLKENHQIIPLTRAQVDITDLDRVLRVIEEISPQVIINAAAFTDVDTCELQKEKAFLINAIGPRNIAIGAQKVKAKLFHISTDYVFDGQKEGPYYECDPPSPINVYGWSKLLGEKMVKEQTHRFFILRVSWLYSPYRKNFVKTILKLAKEKEEIRVVDDQWGTPTSARDVARQIELLMGTEAYGLYHCTSQGSCSRFEFAQQIIRLSGLKTRVIPVKSSEFPTLAKRPSNSVLENFMLKIQGFDIMPEWFESLKKELPRIIEGLKERGEENQFKLDRS